MTKAIKRRGKSLLLPMVIVACLPMLACSQPAGSSVKDGKKMDTQQGQVVYLDVAGHDYLERPIFDIRLNGIEIGSGGALMTGVPIKLGPQVLSWRDAETGVTTKARNRPELKSVDSQFRYLGVHIYPDNTVEIIPERFWPEKTGRGETIVRSRDAKHGK
jgi:hypothetical protein